MTKEQIPVDHQLKSLTVSEGQKEEQQPAPFHIVLVDIKKAAEKRKISCVEIPLSDKDLTFVALSYRWGELEETIIDTQLGYLANITSFDLSDFYVLCQLMMNEPDLESIPYVWVDAICVDQVNPVKRKATIYQMTNIYQRANHILAVPDLHLRHLMNSGGSRNNECIRSVREYSEYIYHLIHGNTDQLYELDEEWLDQINVPKNHHLRQSLARHTDHFVDGIMDLPLHNDSDNATMVKEELKDNIQNAIHASAASNHRSEFVCINPAMRSLFRFNYPSAVNQHQVRTTCSHLPLDNNNNNNSDCNDSHMTMTTENETDWLHCVLQQVKQDEWKQQISQRTESIRQAVYFLADLIKDWSTRVWVVSEYSIAKNKPGHKLKFWFVQFQRIDREGFPFFEFDFGHTIASDDDKNGNSDICIFNNNNNNYHTLTAKAEGIKRYLHDTMIQQLRDQSFLEMILKANASKSEDRFYSILAISKYKHLMTSKQVVSDWHITNTLSVKLRLLDFMTAKDKLDLLFFSFQSPSKCLALPTFATLSITWPTRDDYRAMALTSSQNDMNFDLSDTSTSIQLSHDSIMDLDKLTLKPTEYHACKASAILYDDFYIDKKPVFEALGIEYKGKKRKELYVVLIAKYKDSIMKWNLSPGDIRRKRLHLVGSFTKNKWMLTGSVEFDVTVGRYSPWEYHSTTEDDVGFDIY